MIKWIELLTLNVLLEMDGSPYNCYNREVRVFRQTQKLHELSTPNAYDQTACCCGSTLIRMEQANVKTKDFYMKDGYPVKLDKFIANDCHKGITLVINDDKDEIQLKKTATTLLDEFVLDSGDKIKFAYKSYE